MHAAVAAPHPGSGHEEPSGLSDEKQTPPPGSERESEPDGRSGEIHRRFAGGKSTEQRAAG